jgi:chromosomal replication initiator protein
MAPDPRTGQLWSSVLATLEGDARIPPSLRGFLDLVEPQGVMGSVLYLEVPNDLTRDMLEQRLRVPITDSLVDNAVDIASFKIVVNLELEREEPLPDVIDDPRSEPTVSPIASFERESSEQSSRRVDSRLNPKYVFDNFVIGGSNRFAHAAAVAVAEAPAKA